MTAHDHRRPCRRCGHDERAHTEFGILACSVITDRVGIMLDPYCPCPGYRAMSDEQPAAGRHGEG